MTNSEIVFKAEQQLAENGIIRYTGRTFEGVDQDGNPVTIKEAEPIHTYTRWKELGYQVQKGQKSVAKFAIWKHTTKTDKETGKVSTSMFLKTSAFFSLSQVEKTA